jgi:hypothetical protein
VCWILDYRYSSDIARPKLKDGVGVADVIAEPGAAAMEVSAWYVEVMV